MITFSNNDSCFNYRAAGVAVNEGRVLLQKAGGDTFWTFPGGRVELGEPAEQALKREMLEELDSNVQIVRLLWVIENFFSYAGKQFHELSFYFLMRFEPTARAANQQRYYSRDSDASLTFDWFHCDRATLFKLPLVPTCLQAELEALPTSTRHLVHHDRQVNSQIA